MIRCCNAASTAEAVGGDLGRRLRTHDYVTYIPPHQIRIAMRNPNTIIATGLIPFRFLIKPTQIPSLQDVLGKQTETT